MGYLDGSPPKLEQDDETGEVEDRVSDLHSPAPETAVPEEKEGAGHHYGPCKMPDLPPAVSAARLVAEVADSGRGRCISDLTNQK